MHARKGAGVASIENDARLVQVLLAGRIQRQVRPTLNKTQPYSRRKFRCPACSPRRATLGQPGLAAPRRHRMAAMTGSHPELVVMRRAIALGKLCAFEFECGDSRTSSVSVCLSIT